MQQEHDLGFGWILSHWSCCWWAVWKWQALQLLKTAKHHKQWKALQSLHGSYSTIIITKSKPFGKRMLQRIQTPRTKACNIWSRNELTVICHHPFDALILCQRLWHWQPSEFCLYAKNNSSNQWQFIVHVIVESEIPKSKGTRTRPSVNYAKDWLDLFLLPGLIWSGKESHQWMWSLGGSSVILLCVCWVFSAWWHPNNQTTGWS